MLWSRLFMTNSQVEKIDKVESITRDVLWALRQRLYKLNLSII